MWEEKSVQLSVRLPKKLCRKARRIQRDDSQFFSKVLTYGLTRRSLQDCLHGMMEGYSPRRRSLIPSYDTNFQFNASLPPDMIEHLNEVQEVDPGFLSFVVVHGLSDENPFMRLYKWNKKARQRLIDANMDPDNPG